MRLVRFLSFLVLLAPPLAAQQVGTPGPIEALTPGAFLWAPEVAPQGPVTIVVSTATQRAYVYRNGVPIAVSTVSTGRRGHETPLGVFTILEKRIDHHSNRYDNAPMPYMQRLTWDGVALHGGVLPGYPASHGCIRLPRDFARRLFSITRTGATVVVTDEAAIPEIAPSANPLDHTIDGHMVPADFIWTPDRSPSGPVSLLISGRDHRIIVLRNGLGIGSAPVLVDTPVETTAAYVFQSSDTQGDHWLRLPLPGTPAVLPSLTDANPALAHLSPTFRALILTVLRPGSTLLITRDTLASSGTGVRLRVFEAAR